MTFLVSVVTMEREMKGITYESRWCWIRSALTSLRFCSAYFNEDIPQLLADSLTHDNERKRKNSLL